MVSGNEAIEKGLLNDLTFIESIETKSKTSVATTLILLGWDTKIVSELLPVDQLIWGK